MSQRSIVTRRQFMRSGLAMLSTAATVPLFLQDLAWATSRPDGAATSSLPGVPEDRILVVVELSGGNDGLNTVIPYGNDTYYRARPTIGIKEKEALKLEKHDGLGLHPRLGPIREMMEQGQASIVQGVGYPNPNRSHFASMDIWHSASPQAPKGTGWVGDTVDRLHDQRPGSPNGCICIGGTTPLAAKGRKVIAISFQQANHFQWTGKGGDPRLAKRYGKLIEETEQPAEEDDQLAFVQRAAVNAHAQAAQVRQAVEAGPVTNFPYSPLAGQLKTVASMIRAQLPTRVYYVSLGGFDTHSRQLMLHGELMNQFASGLQAFYRELKAIGQDQRVLTLAFSEFGRRVHENASDGTDHGTAGPMFLLGPMVQPGLVGEHPVVPQNIHADLEHTTDFRSVYASVLDDWFKLDHAKVLGQRFEPLQALNPRKIG